MNYFTSNPPYKINGGRTAPAIVVFPFDINILLWASVLANISTEVFDRVDLDLDGIFRIMYESAWDLAKEVEVIGSFEQARSPC